jgi:hypothetical protein
MHRRARAEPTQRVRQEQAKHLAQQRKGPRRRTEEKPGSREMNLKKMPEEKTLSRRQFLTTFRSPMTPLGINGTETVLKRCQPDFCFGAVRPVGAFFVSSMSQCVT